MQGKGFKNQSSFVFEMALYTNFSPSTRTSNDRNKPFTTGKCTRIKLTNDPTLQHINLPFHVAVPAKRRKSRIFLMIQEGPLALWLRKKAPRTKKKQVRTVCPGATCAPYKQISCTGECENAPNRTIWQWALAFEVPGSEDASCFGAVRPESSPSPSNSDPTK